MPDNSKEKIVKRISKGDTDQVFISLLTYRGQDRIDIRQFYKNSKGEFSPTKRGVSISADYFPELKEGVLALEKAIEDF